MQDNSKKKESALVERLPKKEWEDKQAAEKLTNKIIRQVRNQERLKGNIVLNIKEKN